MKKLSLGVQIIIMVFVVGAILLLLQSIFGVVKDNRTFASQTAISASLTEVCSAPVPTLNTTLISEGEILYRASCADCHGQNLEGSPDWNVKYADGSIPPPPLDSSGNAFNRSNAEISKIILNGKNIGKTSAMPAFQDQLTSQQISSLTQFIKSTWTEENIMLQNNLSVTTNEVWARPAAKADFGAVYLTIYNPTSYEDVLLGAETDAAQSVQVHQTTISDNDLSHMEQLPQLSVPPYGIILFEPGGKHLMLVNLTRDLVVGDSFTLTLNFQNSGEVLITVLVKE